MAKARPIPELGNDDLFAAAAAKVVAVRTRELADQAEGVLDTSDIERVHDMRVATRRLRAALEVFEACFPKRRFRDALKEVKALADALGERRDRDVHIAALTEFEAAVGPADRPGIRNFVGRLRDEQAEANVALAPFVTRERVAALCDRLDELVAEARALVADPEPRRTPATSSASPGMPGPSEGPATETPAATPATRTKEPAPAVTNGGEPR
jgi:CHAD domain-containing protein